MVAEGEIKVMIQGDMAMDSIFAVADSVIERLEEKTFSHEKKISKRVTKEFEKQVQLMEIQVQRALDNRGLESLNEITTVIHDELRAEVPTVFSNTETIFGESKGPFDGKGEGEIFALV